MTTAWVVVENFGGLTEGVKAYQKKKQAVAIAKKRLSEHFDTCHQNKYSVNKRWDDDLSIGDCPGCGDFLIGVHECPVHTEHPL